MIPISGSAYTYAYATLGELVAWIIGWDLILEYAVGNAAVAIAWSGYFASFLRSLRHRIALLAVHSYRDVAISYPDRLAELPLFFGHHIAINVPGIVIVALITWLLVIGVKESARVNNAMVVLKLGVLALFVGVGLFYIEPTNWTPFAPNGWTGIHHGRGHRLLRLHRLRRRLHRGRGDEGPAEEHAHRDPGLSGHLHRHLRDRGAGGHRPRALPAAQGLRSPGPGLRGGRDQLGPGHHLPGRHHLHDRRCCSSSSSASPASSSP